MANIDYWKQIADGMSIDYSTYNETSLQYEETWIKILGELLTGEPLSDTYIPLASQTDRIQAEVDNMPDKELLAGLWLPGYDVTQEGDANNQRVKDWSGNNHGLRGNSQTLNTSSPDGVNFNGNQFIQVAYAANMNTATTGAVTLGSVAAQSLAAPSAWVVSQNALQRSIHYNITPEVRGSLSAVRVAASPPVLNTSAHYMMTGNGSVVNMYKNGVLSNGAAGSGYNSSASSPLYIGRRATGDYFTGSIHCVYMYVNSAQDTNAATINTTINNILTILAE